MQLLPWMSENPILTFVILIILVNFLYGTYDFLLKSIRSVTGKYPPEYKNNRSCEDNEDED